MQRFDSSIHSGVNTIQVNSKQYSCHLCEHKTITQKSLNIHINLIHKGVKYSCHKCEYKAALVNRLTKHIKLKHNEIKYSCHLCEHKYNKQSKLTFHVNSIHNEVKLDLRLPPPASMARDIAQSIYLRLDKKLQRISGCFCAMWAFRLETVERCLLQI